MAKTLFKTTLTAAAIAVGMVVSGANAYLSSPFGRDSFGMDPADAELMKATIRAVLEEYRVGAARTWTSTKTDRGGEAVVTEVFERQGLRCAQVTHRFTSGKGGRTYTAPLCQIADGTWKLAF